MSDWRVDITDALDAFVTVADLAGSPIRWEEFILEFLEAPHTPPTTLPAGKMAIYGFWGAGEWLKIGKAGPKTKARCTSQHYNPGSAPSTLADSLAQDPKMLDLPDFDPARPGDWIKSHTHRVNILLSSRRGKRMLALIEAFLHVRLNPRYG